MSLAHSRGVTGFVLLALCAGAQGEPLPDWSEYFRFSEGLAPVIQGGKMGYIDRSGAIVIKPQFELTFVSDVVGFAEGLAAVQRRGKYGYIDRTGRFVIEPKYDRAGDFEEGLAAVLLSPMPVTRGKGGGNDTWAFIDPKGKTLFKITAAGLWGFSDGLQPVKVDRKWGYINAKGAMVIKPRFSRAFGFSESLAAVKVDGKDGYIDKTGSFVIEPQFRCGAPFSEGLAGVGFPRAFGGKSEYAYIDKRGKIVFKHSFQGAGKFHDGRAGVNSNGKGGYIDKSGKLVIPLQFDCAKDFSDGLAAVARGRYVQPKSRGGLIAECGYFKGKWGYIDKTGKYVIPPSFDGAGRFSQSRACVVVGDVSDRYKIAFGYIDKSGKYIWKPTN